MNFKLFRQECEKEKIPIISKNTERFIINLLEEKKPTNILEIWSAVWYSGLIMANTTKKRNGKVYSFEISSSSYLKAIQNRRTFKIWNIYFYNADFLKINLNKIINTFVDFVFIDWMKRSYLKYFLKSINHSLKGKTTFIFDDVIKYKSKLKDLYKFLEKNQIKYEIKKLDKDDGILIIKWI